MGVAHIDLPKEHIGIPRAQAKRRFNSGEAVLGMAEIHVPEAPLRIRVRIVGVVRNRRLSLRYCRSPLVFVLENLRLRHMGPRIVRLKGQSGVGKFVRAREVARAVVAPLHGHAIVQSHRQVVHRRLVLRVESQRAPAEVYDLAVDRLIPE